VTALSSAQEGLWLAEITTPGTAMYNLPLAIDWTGTVDTDALANALRTVVDRHEPLRTIYDFVDGEPVAVVTEGRPVPFEVVDHADAPDALHRAAQPFDLAAEPPLRCVVWRRPDDDLVLLCVHHIAADGWGMAVLLDELAKAYHREDLPSLPMRYTEAAEQPLTSSTVTERATQLLPYIDDSTESRQRLRGAQHDFAMPDALWAAVTRLARSLATTPFVVLLAAFQVVIAKRLGRAEFLLGTAMANRPDMRTHDLVGCFVNMIPLRCTVDPLWTFEELCRRTGEETLTALEYQHIPYRRLVAATGRGGRPFVEITFGLQTAVDRPAPWRRTRYLPTGTAKYDLNVLLEHNGSSLTGVVEYDVDRCPAPVVRGICDDLLGVLASATHAPANPTGEQG
jgi:hypothetical protein